MGIRLALGARHADVVWTVAAARLASSQISGLLFGLQSTDPLTIAAASVFLGLVAAMASYLPARRASLVDPMVALRNE